MRKIHRFLVILYIAVLLVASSMSTVTTSYAATTPGATGGGGASLQAIADAFMEHQPLPGGYSADGMGFLLYLRLFHPTLWGFLIQMNGAQNLGWMTRQVEGEAYAFKQLWQGADFSSNLNLRGLDFALSVTLPAVPGSAFAAGSLCGQSFTSTTVVATEQGKQEISKLSIGEKVWAYNPATHKKELQPVTQIWINHDNDLLDVSLTLTPGTKAETIHTTQNHLWLTTHGWIKAEDLHIGDQVLRLDGHTATVTQLQLIPGAKKMYDLTVNQIHTFAVGESQYVVHNCTNEEAVIADVLSKSWAQELDVNGAQTTIEVGFFTDPATGDTKLVGSMNSASLSDANLVAELTSKLETIGGTFITTSQGNGAHAEINMLNSPEVAGMTVEGMSGNNYFCNTCGQAVVDAAGGDTSVLGTGWKKDGVTRVSPGYSDPTQFEYIPELEFAPGEDAGGLGNPWVL